MLLKKRRLPGLLFVLAFTTNNVFNPSLCNAQEVHNSVDTKCSITLAANDEEVAKLLYSKAKDYFSSGRYRESNSLTSACLEVVPKSQPNLKAKATVLHAKGLFQLGEVAQATNEMNNGIGQLTDPAEVFHASCDAAAMSVTSRNGLLARQFLLKLPQSDNVRLKFLTGLSQALQLDYRGARENLLQALKQKEENRDGAELVEEIEIHQNLAWILAASDRCDEAIEHAKRALELSSEIESVLRFSYEKAARTDLGIALYRRGQLKEACLELLKAVRIDVVPKDPFAGSPPAVSETAVARGSIPPRQAEVFTVERLKAFDVPSQEILTYLEYSPYPKSRRQFFDFGSTMDPVQYDNQRAELALAVVLNKLGKDVPNSPELASIEKKHLELILPMNCGLQLPKNNSFREFKILALQESFAIEPLLLAEFLEAAGHDDLEKCRFRIPFPLISGKLGNEFSLGPLSAAYSIRTQLQERGLNFSIAGNEKTAMEELMLDSIEWNLRQYEPLALEQVSFVSDNPKYQFFKGWRAVLADNHEEAAAIFSNLLASKSLTDERMVQHATLMLSRALASRGKSKEATSLVAEIDDSIDLDDMSTNGRIGFLSYCAFVFSQSNDHAKAASSLEEILAQSFSAPTWRNQVADALAQEYILAGQISKAKTVIDSELGRLENLKDDQSSKDFVTCKKGRAYLLRSICFDREAQGGSQSLADVKLAQTCRHEAKLDKCTDLRSGGLSETICAKQLQKPTASNYYTISKHHGGRQDFDTKRPVRVYLDLSTVVRADWKADISTISKRSFRDWERVLGKSDWFVFDTTRENADLVVNVYPHASVAGEAGSTESKYNHGSHSTNKTTGTERFRKQIDLYMEQLQPNFPERLTQHGWSFPKEHAFTDNDKTLFKTLILHEIGHSLGLMHSDLAGDVMYFSMEGLADGLSARDIETVRLTYKARCRGLQKRQRVANLKSVASRAGRRKSVSP